jgi:hypothetical protein
MVDARQVTADAVPDMLRSDAGLGEDRMPLLQAASVILALSLGVWGVIGAGLNWLVG